MTDREALGKLIALFDYDEDEGSWLYMYREGVAISEIEPELSEFLTKHYISVEGGTPPETQNEKGS